MTGKSELAITDVLDVNYPHAPEWSADGEFIAILVYVNDGNILLIADTGNLSCSWQLSPNKLAKFTDSEQMRTEVDGHVTGFEWAPESQPAEFIVTTDMGTTYHGNATEQSLHLVTQSPDGESFHKWSPDGKRMAFYRDGRLCVREINSNVERIFDAPDCDAFLPSERMLAWQDDGTRLAFSFTDRESRQVGVVVVETGDLLWRTDSPASSYNPEWLADGRMIFERIETERTVRSILAANPDTGEQTELVRETDNRGIISSGAPTLSPDGVRLALALPLDGWEHLYIINTGTGKRRQLTEGDFEDKGLAGSSPQWVNNETLVFASNRREQGQRQIYTVDTETSDVRPVAVAEGTSVKPRPSPGGDQLAYLHTDTTVSPEVRVRPITDQGEDQPTRVTHSVVEDWPTAPLVPEEVTFESFDGREIEGYLFDPRETDAVADEATDLPGIVWVHGGPMRQMRDGWHPSRSYGLAYSFHQYLAQQGFVGLFVNYRGGIGYGSEFRQALTEGYGHDEMADIVAGADFLRNQRETADTVGIWGLSYGGYATLQILGTHPNVFDVGVNIAGLADLQLYEEWATETKFPAVESSQAVTFGGNPWEASNEWAAASPVTHFGEYKAPLYNFHGTDDSYVNFEQLDVVIDGMLEHGNEYEAEYYPDENHVFEQRTTWQRTFRKIANAFDRHLR